MRSLSIISGSLEVKLNYLSRPLKGIWGQKIFLGPKQQEKKNTLVNFF